MRYQLAIFDLDGTILNTLEDLTISTNTALQSVGFPARTPDEVRSFVGNGVYRLVDRAVPENTPPEMQQKVVEAFHAHYGVHSEDHTAPYPGVPELLRHLKEAGVHSAVVSNKPDYAVKELCTHFFRGLLEEMIGQKDGIRPKPAPDTVEEVLRILHISKENAVYIGDSEVDVLTAQNTGIPAILVDWGFRTREQLVEAGAEVILSDPLELEKMLLG